MSHLSQHQAREMMVNITEDDILQDHAPKQNHDFSTIRNYNKSFKRSTMA